jgi:CDP-glycerol glycerophosphotransferase (TagB/SpsB family)
MIKNIKIKKVLKTTVFPVLSVVNKIIPKRDDYILLHAANMGIGHNLAPLRDYLLNEGYGENNKIICEVEDEKYAETQYDVTYVSYIQSIFYFLRTRHVFYTTGQIPIKPSKKQIVIHLDHGAAGFKTFGAISNIHNGNEFYFTYYMAPSEVYVPIAEKALRCKRENILINDEPVADVLLTSRAKYNLGKYKKIGIWLPTFRQSEYLGYSDSQEENLLPMFSESDYIELNDMLKKCDIKLIVKIHSGQNLEKYKKTSFSNLEIISQEDMVKKGWELYSLLAQMDFLISDYSSVYLQYLLLNRPIGFVVPDFEEYLEKRGSVFENPREYMPGAFITEKKELYTFFSDLSEGIDNYELERQKVCKLIHKYKDPNNCKRLISISDIKL